MYGAGFSGSVRWSPKGPGVYKDQRTSVEEFSNAIYNGCDRGPEDRVGFGKFCSGVLRRKTRFLPISGVRGISGRRTEPGKKSGKILGRSGAPCGKLHKISFPGIRGAAFFSHAVKVRFLKMQVQEWKRFIILP